MGRFRSQLLLADNIWSTHDNIPKNDRHSNSVTDWAVVNLDFRVKIYGNKLIYCEKETSHADKLFSKITKTLSVCYMNNVLFFVKDLFESIPDYRKIVLIMFLFKNDVDLLHEYGF